MESNPRYVSVQTKEVVGRRSEIEAIEDALSASTRDVRVIIFVGPAGIGKTRLTQEARRLAQQRGLPASKLIDLYHLEYRTPLGLVTRTLQGFGQTQFPQYTQLETEFKQALEHGSSPARLEELRRRLTDTFVNEYNAVASRQRCLLAFDTAELLQFESDIIQEICQVSETSSEVRSWLTEVMPRLENTVVVLAGRADTPAQTKLWESLKSTFADRAHSTPDRFLVSEYPLESFRDVKETRQYFIGMRAALIERGCTAEEAKKAEDVIQSDQDLEILHRCAEGRPIQLSLVFDLVVHTDNLGQFFMKLGPETNWEVVEKHLFEEIAHQHIGFKPMLHYLGITRLGLNKHLLCQLAPEWTLEECQQQLDAMREYTFVKLKENTDLLFLHDKLYEMLDMREFRPNWKTTYKVKYETILNYYQTLLEKLPKIESNWQMLKEIWDEIGLTGDDSWADKTPAIIREQLEQELKIRVLHYQLRVNAKEGYELYAKWDEEAIKAHQNEFDMLLRNDALLFHNDPENLHLTAPLSYRPDRDAIDRDCAARWVKRHVARGNSQRAVEVAETILAYAPERYRSLVGHPKELAARVPKHLRPAAQRLFGKEAPLFWAQLLTTYGEALAYTKAPTKNTLQALERAIEDAKKARKRTKPDDIHQQWLINLTLGQAHNNAGYVNRVSGDLGDALQWNEKALPHFIAIGDDAERANTLNNMAYCNALLGLPDLAETLNEEALQIREQRGQRYTLALSYNTRGLIHVLKDHPMWGVRECQRALEVSRQAKEPRVEGLALIGLGFAFRKRGDQWKLGEVVYPPDEAAGFFEEGRKHLLEALAIFQNKVIEPSRVWETFNELGSLYCDWGWLERHHLSEAEAKVKYEEAIRWQEQAVELAHQVGLRLQEADSCDDLAQVWADLGDLPTLGTAEHRKEGREWLARAERLIPAEFKLREKTGLARGGRPGASYWQLLGKTHRQRGLWEFRELKRGEYTSKQQAIRIERGIRYLALAAAYFQAYWSGTFALNQTLQSFVRYLRQQGVTSGEAQRVVREVEGAYRVNLTVLTKTIRGALGATGG
jgi:tetratricopeptide (TPR) repeat protein